jgi:hypothetical protein
MHQQFLSVPNRVHAAFDVQGIGGRSRNAAVGPPFKTLSRTRDKDGEDESILQNAVYENIGEYDKVVYVFAYEHEQGHPAQRQGVDDLPKGPNLLPVPRDPPDRSRLTARVYGRFALKAESHHRA